jgi:hypothetical protein
MDMSLIHKFNINSSVMLHHIISESNTSFSIAPRSFVETYVIISSPTKLRRDIVTLPSFRLILKINRVPDSSKD